MQRHIVLFNDKQTIVLDWTHTDKLDENNHTKQNMWRYRWWLDFNLATNNDNYYRLINLLNNIFQVTNIES